MRNLLISASILASAVAFGSPVETMQESVKPTAKPVEAPKVDDLQIETSAQNLDPNGTSWFARITDSTNGVICYVSVSGSATAVASTPVCFKK